VPPALELPGSEYHCKYRLHMRANELPARPIDCDQLSQAHFDCNG